MYPEYDEILCQLDGLWNKFRAKQQNMLARGEYETHAYKRIATILTEIQEKMTWIEELHEEYPD